MPRRMADPRYRAEQWEHRYDAHVEPLNRLVDELGETEPDSRPPYIAPMYRGVHARVLAVLRDPGPRAGGVRGSGFLSVENDDQTAERQTGFFAEAGLDPAEVVPWNAYPWYINAAPSKEQLRRGLAPLRRVVDLMADLRVVLLAGKDAQAAWQLFTAEHGAVVAARGVQAVATYHPSRQALQHPDPGERERREEDIRAALRRVVTIVGDAAPTVRETPGPAATALAALLADGFEVDVEHGASVVRGTFRNPLNAAARAATDLFDGEPFTCVAATGSRSVIIARSADSVAMLDSAVGRWRVYPLRRPTTPLSLFGRGEGVPPTRQVLAARPVPTAVTALAGAADLDALLVDHGPRARPRSKDAAWTDWDW